MHAAVRLLIVVSGFLAFFSSGLHASDTHIVYVAPKGSVAYDYAKSMEESANVISVERRIHRAFNEASEFLIECGECNVDILIAAGIYQGKAKTGTWSFPDTKAPQASLRILGGYNDSFDERTPFVTPTYLQISKDRSGPVLSFLGKKHALQSLVISGLVIDTGPSNAYDKKSNSHLKGSSSSWTQIALGYITTNSLTMSDNVFMNAPHAVASPRIRAMSNDATINIENNIFYNNIYTWHVDTGGGKHQVADYRIVGNSFILNWPYNPDANTSDPGAIQIGNRHVASQITIDSNLFAYNVGGAIFPKWDDIAGPEMQISNNLFYENGKLFNVTEPGEGAIVGKFNRSATYTALDIEDVEDDFEWDVFDNTDEDPNLSIDVLTLKSVVYASAVRGILEESEKDTSQGSKGVDELDALSRELAELLGEDDTDESAVSDTSEDDTGSDDEGSLFADLLEETEVLDAEGDIQNYAPYVAYAPSAMPLPANPQVAQYGASPERVLVSE